MGSEIDCAGFLDLHPHPILSGHSEYSLSDFPYKKPDQHTLSDFIA
jgi:hypothetical protein